MHKDCFQCDYKQVSKISEFLSIDQSIEEELNKKVKTYLEHCDMTKTNPEIMADIWKIIAITIQNNNPYKEIKSYYNHFLFSLLPEIKEYIHDDLSLALKVAIAANLIDFSAKDKISKQYITDILFSAKDLRLSIDDSKELFQTIEKSQTLLYLGDNCGEIVLDKLFLTMLKNKYRHLHIYYGVRGYPIVNDVTLEDADEVNMHEVAKVISNGDGSLGTVLSRCEQSFQNLFHQVDIVACKGQGNYEGLMGCSKENLFFLFMSKCQLVAKLSKTNILDIVCMKNNT